MYEIKDLEYKIKAIKAYGDMSKEQLIEELCYWKDKYYVASQEAYWLNDLADHLRDTADEYNKESEQISYKEYQEKKKHFIKRYHD